MIYYIWQADSQAAHGWQGQGSGYPGHHTSNAGGWGAAGMMPPGGPQHHYQQVRSPAAVDTRSFLSRPGRCLFFGGTRFFMVWLLCFVVRGRLLIGGRASFRLETSVCVVFTARMASVVSCVELVGSTTCGSRKHGCVLYAASPCVTTHRHELFCGSLCRCCCCCCWLAALLMLPSVC